MNTASRMESTGEKNRVQVSQATADRLIADGKEKWLTPREGGAEAKGKGVMNTYWVDLREESFGTGSMTMSTTSFESDHPSSHYVANVMKTSSVQTHSTRSFDGENPSNKRMIQWNVELLSQLLRQVMARAASNASSRKRKAGGRFRDSNKRLAKNGTILDEVKDVLALPKFDSKIYARQVDPDSIQLSSQVTEQLASYVTGVARLYQQNPFHNFEHASHVTQSVTKLLSRILRPTDNEGAENLHDNTFGITSDPITQFACVLSALIHDAAHDGVPNSVLVAENHRLSTKYNGKCVAEQNSLEVCWHLLMQPEYGELRACIYTNDEDLERFRQTLVCLVLATDIMDEDLGKQRKERWNRAFSADSFTAGEQEQEAVNRKATIVLEHLIQASDVSHTMQHWHVFKQWNQSLFNEMYLAYKEGRSEKDPSMSWYEGEIGFFDFYIIPLAKKLETCGVFGVCSMEYLSYAQANREEWAAKGKDIVLEYLADFQRASEEHFRVPFDTAPKVPNATLYEC